MAGVKVWYDNEGDFLDITFEEAPATMEEIEDDLFERRSIDGRVIGFSLLNFSKHNRHPITVPFAITAQAEAV